VTTVKQEIMPETQSETTHTAANQPAYRPHELQEAPEVAAAGSGKTTNRSTTMNMMVKATAMKPAKLAGRADAARNNGRPTLGDLIANLIATKAAAEAACTKQGEAEKKYKFVGKERPKVFGGMTEPTAFKRGDTFVEWPASEWFYSDRENIERDHAKALAAATNDAERGEVEGRFTAMLAEWDRQEKACEQIYPRELRVAESAADRALNKWTRAEKALVNYLPASMVEAVELLALAGKDSSARDRVMPYLDIDEHDYCTLVGNCVAVLKRELAH
jgi:hypothetical protein